MLDYRMIGDKDTILVAVSGGIDSLVLCLVLHHWRRKAPIDYQLHGIHVTMQEQGKNNTAATVEHFFQQLGINYDILPAAFQPPFMEQDSKGNNKNICFHCSRLRRNQLFAFAKENEANAIALGHHRDDIVETFLLNLFYGGNISTMRPKQRLFSGKLKIIRPLSYLSKDAVEKIGEKLGLKACNPTCPLSENTKRKDMGELLATIEKQIPDARKKIFAALGNVRADYLLHPEQEK